MGKYGFHKFIYLIGRLPLALMMRLKYGFRTDRIPETHEPFLLLSNHTTEDDMFMTVAASRKHMYFVCGEHLMRNKTYGGALRTLADPIPVPKGGTSVKALIEMIKRLQSGKNICMFHEGKRSFHGETIPAPESIGTLVKKAGCTLITYKIQGGYFTYPRWARGHKRRGHVEGHVAGVYDSAYLSSLSDREIADTVNRDLYENAYSTQREKMWVYRGKNLAAGLDYVLFVCSECGTWDRMVTDGNTLSCEHCGKKWLHDEYGFLRGENTKFDNVLDWMRWIEKEFDTKAAQLTPSEMLFSHPSTLLYRMDKNYRNTDLLTDTADVYTDRIEIGGYVFPFGDITALSILYGNIVLFTYRQTYYGLTGDGFCAWKCARLWHLAKGDTDDPAKEI